MLPWPTLSADRNVVERVLRALTVEQLLAVCASLETFRFLIRLELDSRGSDNG